MAVDSAGTGRSGNNTGNSPIIAEIINITSTQVTYVNSLNASRTKPRGIFRFYTEHANERHFELHPVTEFFKWNGSSFVFDSEYRTNNIRVDPEGATKALSTYTDLVQGNNQSVTATVLADNIHIMFT
jgi:NAD(P)H-flavin reductase